MRLLLIVLAIYFTNIFSQEIDKAEEGKIQENANVTLEASFRVASDLPYGMASFQVSKDTTYSGIGNYQIRDSKNVYVRGCCVGDTNNEYQQDLNELNLHFNKKYQVKVQYYFYSGISRAYERARYLKFRTPPYDDKIKSFILQVRFNEAGGVSLTLESRE